MRQKYRSLFSRVWRWHEGKAVFSLLPTWPGFYFVSISETTRNVEILHSDCHSNFDSFPHFPPTSIGLSGLFGYSQIWLNQVEVESTLDRFPTERSSVGKCIQRAAKKFFCFAKHHPGSARQKYTQPGKRNLADLFRYFENWKYSDSPTDRYREFVIPFRQTRPFGLIPNVRLSIFGVSIVMHAVDMLFFVRAEWYHMCHVAFLLMTYSLLPCPPNIFSSVHPVSR